MDTHQPLKNYEDHESHHQGSNHVLIAPTSLLTLNTRTPKSTLSDAFNPRYFQAYTDAVDENQNMTKMKEYTQRTVPPDTHDSSQRLLQEFVVRNHQRVKGHDGIPLLSLKRGARQNMYTDLTADIESNNSANNTAKRDMDEGYAATRIQGCYRGKLGRKEFDKQVKEYERRERAAVRVQCAWRGKSRYSQFLLARARGYDENNAATRLQSMIRGKNDRKKFLHKRAFMSKQEIMATRIQCAFRGRQDRARIMKMRRERGSLVATTNAWGESENGLALLVDLSGFNSKFDFSNVMSFTLPAEASSTGFKGGYTKAWEGSKAYDSDDDQHENELLLDELKGESAGIAKQLARIEVMASELEEDFAKTGNDIHLFQKAMSENMGDMRNIKVANMLNIRTREDERWEKEESRAKKGGRREAGRMREAREDAKKWGAEAEDDMAECWDLINQLQGQLYTGSPKNTKNKGRRR